jgi:hypothetical protein
MDELFLATVITVDCLMFLIYFGQNINHDAFYTSHSWR